MSILKKYYYGILLYTFTLLVFVIKFGWKLLNPLFSGWLYGNGMDALPDVSTWEYYRYSDYNGLIGVMYGYAWPQPVGIGNTNIIPWIAMPLHWIEPLLPAGFHHFGWFLLLCYLLQAYFGNKLLLLLKVDNKLYRFIGVAFLVLSSSLLDRHPHIALNAHFLILASFCVYFDHTSPGRKLLHISLISFFAAMTHPYLIVFPLVIGAVTFLRLVLQKKIKWYSFILHNIVNVAPVVFAFYISGVFSLPSGSSASTGLGYYSSSLDTFFNNQGKAFFSFLSFKTYYAGQYEGYGYLGLGVLVLWIYLLLHKSFYAFLLRVIKSNFTLFIALLLLTVYAFALQITFLDIFRTGFTLHEHTFLYKVLSIFRSSGRYIWALHQVLLILPVVFISKYQHHFRTRSSTIVIVAFILQLIDMSKAVYGPRFIDYYKPRPGFEKSISILSNVTGIIYTFPAFNRGLDILDDEQYFIASLAPGQKRITSGHLPRPDYKVQDSIKGLTEQIINEGKWLIEKEDVILTSRLHDFNFHKLIEQDRDIHIKELGNYRILFHKDNTTVSQLTKSVPDIQLGVININDYLAQYTNSNCYLLISTKDEASSSLDSTFRARFGYSKISGLKTHDAYIGFWKGKEILYERLAAKDINYDTVVAAGGRNLALRISSRSNTQNADEDIIVGDKSYSPKSRGINIVVLDSSFQVIDVRFFDTYRTLYNHR